jgi:hypothetical protein
MSVFFLYNANSSFVFFRCTVSARKLMELFISFSIVYFILICCLLDSIKVLHIYSFGRKL